MAKVVIMQTDTAKPTLMERIREHRVALTATAVPLMTVGAASAAVNFTPIEELIQAVTGLIPSFLDLVVALAPLNQMS